MGGQKPHLLITTSQQPRRRDPRSLRARRPSSTCGQGSRQAVGHPAAVPGARRRAGRDLRPDQPQPLRHPLRLPPRLLRRRGARVPRLRPGGAVGHREHRRVSSREHGSADWRERRRRLARAAGPHEDVVPHRRLPGPRAACRASSPGCSTARTSGSTTGSRPWRDDDDQARKRLLDDTVLPAGLTLDEEREACRALKGSMLRQEIYAQDGTGKADHPYTVTEQNFTVRMLQARGRQPARRLLHPCPRGDQLPLRAQSRRPADIAHAHARGRPLRQRAEGSRRRLRAPSGPTRR